MRLSKVPGLSNRHGPIRDLLLGKAILSHDDSHFFFHFFPNSRHSEEDGRPSFLQSLNERPLEGVRQSKVDVHAILHCDDDINQLCYHMAEGEERDKAVTKLTPVDDVCGPKHVI